MPIPFTKPNRPLTWLITGSSSGFGLSLVRLLQSHGHTVIATSRNPSRTPDLVSEVESKGGKWLELDVTHPNSGTIIADLEDAGTPIDVLVNNAGFAIYAPAESIAEDEVRSEVETLYLGPFRLIRAALPHMRRRRFGVVVNMSSGAALEGRESMGAYAGAKAALDGMSKVLAKEVAPFNVRVLTVSIGTFNTNLGNAVILSKNPISPDYERSVAAQTMEYMASGRFAPDGDKEKAVRAIYEVVVGEGVGKGHEGERLLPLGRDLAPRLKLIQEQMEHALEVFGDVCGNVYIEK